jgi:ABC-type Fe3+/spermidine/putrescine transport system ATPase subunit
MDEINNNEQQNQNSLVLRTEGLVKRYGKRTVANGVSINVKQGEIVGLLGPNGAGKTTSFYMTTGLVVPNEGHVFLGDQEITDFPVYKRARAGIGYLPQEASVFRKMEKAASKPVSPDKKILELIMTHLDAIKMVVYRNGTLRADFFRDIWRVEAMRKEFDRKETALFRRVLHEGKELNLFDIDNVEITADILHYCIKGIEVPYIRGQIGEELDDETGWRYVAKIVYGALGCKKKENNHIV